MDFQLMFDFQVPFWALLLARNRGRRLRTVRAVVADLANQNKEIRLINMEIQKP